MCKNLGLAVVSCFVRKHQICFSDPNLKKLFEEEGNDAFGTNQCNKTGGKKRKTSKKSHRKSSKKSHR